MIVTWKQYLHIVDKSKYKKDGKSKYNWNQVKMSLSKKLNVDHHLIDEKCEELKSKFKRNKNYDNSFIVLDSKMFCRSIHDSYNQSHESKRSGKPKHDNTSIEFSLEKMFEEVYKFVKSKSKKANVDFECLVCHLLIRYGGEFSQVGKKIVSLKCQQQKSSFSEKQKYKKSQTRNENGELKNLVESLGYAALNDFNDGKLEKLNKPHKSKEHKRKEAKQKKEKLLKPHEPNNENLMVFNVQEMRKELKDVDDNELMVYSDVSEDYYKTKCGIEAMKEELMSTYVNGDAGHLEEEYEEYLEEEYEEYEEYLEEEYEEYLEEDSEKKSWEEDYEERQKEKRRKKLEEEYKNQKFAHLGESTMICPTTADPKQMEDERDRDLQHLFGDRASAILAKETKMMCHFQKCLDNYQPDCWPIVPINFKV